MEIEKLALFLLLFIVTVQAARKIAKHKFYKISVTKYPALYLTASEAADWENQIPAEVYMKEWRDLPEQKWKIHSMSNHKYYLSSLENDYNKLSISVTDGRDTSMKFVRLKNVSDGGDNWNILDMQGHCMQFKRDNILRQLINRFSGDETGLVWRKCNDSDSQKWILTSL